MLFRVSAAALTLLLVLAAPAGAASVQERPKAVLELFTSQGCSSCPGADALLEQLGARKDVLTLAYHVDYWDYVGWQDTFGAAANSQRQRDYAQSWGSGRIFTPQMVVNGRTSVVASRKSEVEVAVDGATLVVPVALSTRGDTLEVNVAAQPGHNPAVIWLVPFIDKAKIQIERGENAGKSMTYTQIVTGRQALGMWDAAKGTRLTLPLAEVLTAPANGAVIMVQEEKAGLPGAILGAAAFTR